MHFNQAGSAWAAVFRVAANKQISKVFDQLYCGFLLPFSLVDRFFENLWIISAYQIYLLKIKYVNIYREINIQMAVVLVGGESGW